MLAPLSREGNPSELDLNNQMADIEERQAKAGSVMGEILAGEWLVLNEQLKAMQAERLTKEGIE